MVTSAQPHVKPSGRSVDRPSQQYVSIGGAAAILGISQKTVHRAIERGDLPSFTLGCRKLVPLSALRMGGESGNE